MIKIKNVKKYYGTKKNAIYAIDNISLTIDKGEFVIITGPSGSGKTTFLNLIGGMTVPDEGEIVIAGERIHKMGDKRLSTFRSEHMGFIFQFQSMIPTLNALENVQLPFMFTKNGKYDDISKTLLTKVGLGDRIHAYAHELSAGQKRRVSIARALAKSPELLICDEPTGDLDPETERVITDMIKDANNNGATVIFTTHNHHLRKLGSRNFNIVKGRIFET